MSSGKEVLQQRMRLRIQPNVVKCPMPAARLDDPILKRFRAALAARYGDRIERVVLHEKPL